MTMQAALSAAGRGWHVFPCEGKQPRPRWKWKQWNTTDPARAGEWFATDCPAGIACGPSQLVVIDLDTGGTLPPPWDTVPGVTDGADVYAVLAEANDGGWPETYTVRTPRSGWHFYFQAGSHGIRNSASQIGPMIDVRADGGFVVAAGSRRPDGEYTLIYDHEPAPLPDWLATLAAKAKDEPQAPRPVRHTPASDRGGYVRAALEAETTAVATAPKGARNDQLNKSAFALARFIRDGQLSENTLTEALVGAALHAGLTAIETRRTIRSALQGRHV